jgi:hypothetical protein
MSPLESFLHLFDIICMVGDLFYTLKWSRLFINAKKIKVECTLIQSHSVALKLWHIERKLQSPKMMYPKSVLFSEYKCRLSGGILSTRSIAKTYS